MPLEYKQFTTADGSPSLYLGSDSIRMHAEEGAFTERQLIYQPLVETAFDTIKEPVFLSLGLGLGYNELTIAFESLKCSQTPALIASYETVHSLKENFVKWLNEEPSDLSEVYDKIAGLYEQKYKQKISAAKSLLLKLIESHKFQLLGAIEKNTPPVSHAILFDAFSPKTCPQLWEPEFLDKFFELASAKPCFVATHACNAALKQALKKNGFTLDIQKGFGRKRESMSAYRLVEF